MNINLKLMILLFISYFTFQSCSSIKTSYELRSIQEIDPTILVDVRYATKNNFTGRILYNSSKVYLIKEVAESLANVNKYVKTKYGYRIKVFDGYRPLSVQKIMWSIVHDERYVANPQKGSRHNRGCAVDLTLVDSLNNEINMGTSYDDFTEKAHRNYEKLSDEVIRNRKILEEAMIKHGFIPLETEWWHFDFRDWKKYPLLDIKIED